MHKGYIWMVLLTLWGLAGCDAAGERPVSAVDLSPPAAAAVTPLPAPTQTAAASLPPDDWTRTARIGTPYDYLYSEEQPWRWEEWVDEAVADGVNVILDWTCASDDWECLQGEALERALTEIRRRADYIHSRHPGVHYIMYVGPLEAVTGDLDNDLDGQIDPGQEARSLYLQHPDWLQVGIDGRPAVFSGVLPGMPFWVCETCEDVWLSPAHPEFRRLTLDKAARLAVSGLDGLWFDVPFLSFDFGDGWRNQWADVSPAARTLFHQQTGLSLPEPPCEPDWDDPVWQTYVTWRYRLIRDFVAEYDAVVHRANPDFRLIMETSVDLGPSSTQTAASPLDLPLVSDVTAHEGGGVERPRQYFLNLKFLSTLLAWRHVDMSFGQPSWLLSYVEAGHPDTVDMARLHAAMVLAAGFNYYTSGEDGMAQVVDRDFRRLLFPWIQEHESVLYPPAAQPYARVALLYSQATIDYRDRGDWERSDRTDAFYGMMGILLESHVPFAVLSERDLARLDAFSALVMPQVEALSDAQAETIRAWVRQGGTLIVTGEEAALYDEWGNPRTDYALADLFGVRAGEADWQIYARDVGEGRVVYTPINVAQEFLWAGAWWDERGEAAEPAQAEAQRRFFVDEIWAAAAADTMLETDAPPTVLFLPYQRRNGLSLRLVNLSEVAYGDPIPAPQRVSVTLTLPDEVQALSVENLSFLAPAPQALTFTQEGHRLHFECPVDWAAWIEITFAP